MFVRVCFVSVGAITCWFVGLCRSTSETRQSSDGVCSKFRCAFPVVAEFWCAVAKDPVESADVVDALGCNDC